MPQPTPILACSRPSGPVARLLRERGVEVAALPLEVDWRPLPDRYFLGDGRVAERFTIAQFERAIVRKTLFLTARDLRSQEVDPIFVIEGAGFHEYGSLHPNAVRGALSALITEYRGSVLRTTDPEDTAELLTIMARHTQFGVPEISVAAKRKAGSPADEQRRIVEMLPGVGFTLARRLLQRFGSIHRLLSASAEDLAQVSGFSVQRAQTVLDVVHREYCAVDFEEEIELILAEQPALLFEGSVALVARQHVFSDAEGRRLIADLILVDDAQQTAYVVEVKRGAVQRSDVRQLSAYLNAADRCPLLGDYRRRGYELRGILAAPDSRVTQTEDERIEVRLVDVEQIATELMRWRQRSE